MSFIDKLFGVFSIKNETQNSNWQKLISEQGKFSVLIPGMSTYKKHTVNTQAGMLDLHEYSLNKTNIAFSASYCDYPASIVKQSSTQVMLNNVRDGVISGMHGRLISELIVEINGNPGSQLHVEISGGAGIMKGYIYLVSNRLYQISVATSKQNAFSTDLSKYLESFKLLLN